MKSAHPMDRQSRSSQENYRDRNHSQLAALLSSATKATLIHVSAQKIYTSAKLPECQLDFAAALFAVDVRYFLVVVDVVTGNAFVVEVASKSVFYFPMPIDMFGFSCQK